MLSVCHRSRCNLRLPAGVTCALIPLVYTHTHTCSHMHSHSGYQLGPQHSLFFLPEIKAVWCEVLNLIWFAACPNWGWNCLGISLIHFYAKINGSKYRSETDICNKIKRFISSCKHLILLHQIYISVLKLCTCWLNRKNQPKLGKAENLGSLFFNLFKMFFISLYLFKKDFEKKEALWIVRRVYICCC